MRRKILIMALGFVFQMHLGLAEAQQVNRIPRIGLLSAQSASRVVDRVDAFQKGLR